MFSIFHNQSPINRCLSIIMIHSYYWKGSRSGYRHGLKDNVWITPKLYKLNRVRNKMNEAKKLYESLNLVGSLTLAASIPWIIFRVFKAIYLQRGLNQLPGKVSVCFNSNEVVLIWKYHDLSIWLSSYFRPIHVEPCFASVLLFIVPLPSLVASVISLVLSLTIWWLSPVFTYSVLVFEDFVFSFSTLSSLVCYIFCYFLLLWS